jgi:hypothetical protein
VSAKRFELRRKTVRLIIEDRRAAGRDATRLQNWERDVEVGIREVNRMMREGLERLTAMGI